MFTVKSELFINEEFVEPAVSNKKQTSIYNIIHAAKIRGTTTIYVHAMATWCLGFVKPWCICYLCQFFVLSY